MSVGVVAMGRPKKGAEKPDKAPNPDARVAIIHLKGTEDYAAWLDSLSEQTHIAKATLFRVAMAEYAKNHGHTAPPAM